MLELKESIKKFEKTIIFNTRASIPECVQQKIADLEFTPMLPSRHTLKLPNTRITLNVWKKDQLNPEDCIISLQKIEMERGDFWRINVLPLEMSKSIPPKLFGNWNSLIGAIGRANGTIECADLNSWAED